MSINALDAASAYARTIGSAGSIGSGAPAPAGSAGEAPGASFGAMVDKVIQPARYAAAASERASAAMVAGRGDLVDVVSAVTAAETSLETLVAVRDKVISAYQDIMRMPI